MARIRTIKPDFFTSEDILELSPLARLLYIAIWCEADRKGRLVWKPKTFKIRYLPAENCNIDSLCEEILERGIVVLYGDGLAWIPSFSKHQHINPRESASILPEPPRDNDAMLTREPRDSDAQGGKEGKEIDSASKTRTRSPKKTPLPADFGISERVIKWAIEKGYGDLDAHLEYFKSKALAKGYTYLDWDEAFIGAIREDWAKRRTPSSADSAIADPFKGAI